MWAIGWERVLEEMFGFVVLSCFKWKGGFKLVGRFKKVLAILREGRDV